jgi:hypothetical protein
VIVTMHVASGAVAGALLRSRAAAVVAGPLLHILADRIPHQDVGSRNFEIVSGLGLLALVAVGRGPLDPTVFGAGAAAAPDLEHVLPLPRPGGRDLFPSHRIPGWHRSGGIPVWLQLVAAGLIVGVIVSSRKES